MRNLVQCIRAGHGFYTYEVESFEVFLHQVAPHFVETSDVYLWRGSRDPTWTLNSTIARKLMHLNLDPLLRNRKTTALSLAHIINFIENLRGLNLLNLEHNRIYDIIRSFTPIPPETFLWVLSKMTEFERRTVYELLSFGQHYGLATPFLDWTRTPLVALFFAFQRTGSSPNGVGRRAVYAINKTFIESIVNFDWSRPSPNDIVFLESMSHDNPRVIGQSGSFTFVPANTPIEDWVVKKVHVSEPRPSLIRFLIRNVERERCLAYLDAMNINSRTLFPDKVGASDNANYQLERLFKKYTSHTP